jgi:hypothetical protein
VLQDYLALRVVVDLGVVREQVRGDVVLNEKVQQILRQPRQFKNSAQQ